MGDRGVEVRWAEGTSRAERIVHDTLRLAVGFDVRLLPQVMLRVGERGAAQEVEADLIVVDPAHGVTVVEVKGGTRIFDPGRNLWRRREASGQEVRDPVAQVKRALAIVNGRWATWPARWPGLRDDPTAEPHPSVRFGPRRSPEPFADERLRGHRATPPVWRLTSSRSWH